MGALGILLVCALVGAVPSPEARYRFENNYDDSSANVYHGSSPWDVSIVDDPVRGKVLSLGNQGSYLNTPTPVGAVGPSLTVCTWFKIPFPNYVFGNNGTSTILGAFTATPSPGGFALTIVPDYITPSGGYAVDLASYSSSGASWWSMPEPVPALATDSWHHLCARLRGAIGERSLFLNGTLISTRTTGSSYTPISPAVATTIGRSSFASLPVDPMLGFPGLLDELAVFNTDLTNADIVVEYLSTLPPPPSSYAVTGLVTGLPGGATVTIGSSAGPAVQAAVASAFSLNILAYTAFTLTISSLPPRTTCTATSAATGTTANAPLSVGVAFKCKSLLADYGFETGFQDTSGYGHHGSLGTLVYDDERGMVMVASSPSTVTATVTFDLTTSYTISSWVKLTSGSIVQAVSRGAAGPGLSLLPLTMSHNSGAHAISVAGVPAADGVWRHLLVTYDLCVGFQAYVDGVAAGSPVAKTCLDVVTPATGTAITLGGFTGRLDDLRLWSGALTAADAASEYSNTRRLLVTGTVQVAGAASATLTSTAPMFPGMAIAVGTAAFSIAFPVFFSPWTVVLTPAAGTICTPPSITGTGQRLNLLDFACSTGFNIVGRVRGLNVALTGVNVELCDLSMVCAPVTGASTAHPFTYNALSPNLGWRLRVNPNPAGYSCPDITGTNARANVDLVDRYDIFCYPTAPGGAFDMAWTANLTNLNRAQILYQSPGLDLGPVTAATLAALGASSKLPGAPAVTSVNPMRLLATTACTFTPGDSVVFRVTGDDGVTLRVGTSADPFLTEYASWGGLPSTAFFGDWVSRPTQQAFSAAPVTASAARISVAVEWFNSDPAGGYLTLEAQVNGGAFSPLSSPQCVARKRLVSDAVRMFDEECDDGNSVAGDMCTQFTVDYDSCCTSPLSGGASVCYRPADAATVRVGRWLWDGVAVDSDGGSAPATLVSASLNPSAPALARPALVLTAGARVTVPAGAGWTLGCHHSLSLWIYVADGSAALEIGSHLLTVQNADVRFDVKTARSQNYTVKSNTATAESTVRWGGWNFITVTYGPNYLSSSNSLAFNAAATIGVYANGREVDRVVAAYDTSSAFFFDKTTLYLTASSSSEVRLGPMQLHSGGLSASAATRLFTGAHEYCEYEGLFDPAGARYHSHVTDACFFKLGIRTGSPISRSVAVSLCAAYGPSSGLATFDSAEEEAYAFASPELFPEDASAMLLYFGHRCTASCSFPWDTMVTNGYKPGTSTPGVARAVTGRPALDSDLRLYRAPLGTNYALGATVTSNDQILLPQNMVDGDLSTFTRSNISSANATYFIDPDPEVELDLGAPRLIALVEVVTSVRGLGFPAKPSILAAVSSVANYSLLWWDGAAYQPLASAENNTLPFTTHNVYAYTNKVKIQLHRNFTIVPMVAELRLWGPGDIMTGAQANSVTSAAVTVDGNLGGGYLQLSAAADLEVVLSKAAVVEYVNIYWGRDAGAIPPTWTDTCTTNVPATFSFSLKDATSGLVTHSVSILIPPALCWYRYRVPNPALTKVFTVTIDSGNARVVEVVLTPLASSSSAPLVATAPTNAVVTGPLALTEEADVLCRRSAGVITGVSAVIPATGLAGSAVDPPGVVASFTLSSAEVPFGRSDTVVLELPGSVFRLPSTVRNKATYSTVRPVPLAGAVVGGPAGTSWTASVSQLDARSPVVVRLSRAFTSWAATPVIMAPVTMTFTLSGLTFSPAVGPCPASSMWVSVEKGNTTGLAFNDTATNPKGFYAPRPLRTYSRSAFPILADGQVTLGSPVVLSAAGLGVLPAARAPAAGGSTLTVVGNFFSLTGQVLIDGVPCAPSTYVTITQMECTTPPGAGWDVDVSYVTGSASLPLPTLPGVFSYVGPTLFALNPQPAQVGSTVTVTGINFFNTPLLYPGGTYNLNLEIEFDGVLCGQTVYVSTTQALCVGVPEGMGLPSSVVLYNRSPSWKSRVPTAPLPATYSPPYVLGVVPQPADPGVDVVNITGFAFGRNASALSGITVDGLPCTSPVWFSSSMVQCTSPAGGYGALLDVQVTVGSIASVPNTLFAFISAPPVVTAVLPPGPQPTAGGNNVTLLGTLFGATPRLSQVSLGGRPCAAFQWLSSTSAICTVPPGAGRDLSASVVSVGIPSPANTLFAYQPPVANAVVPSVAPAGSRVTVYGANFWAVSVAAALAGSVTVTVGGLPCALVGYTVPAGPAVCDLPASGFGAGLSVGVTVSGQVSAPNSLFSYSISAPVVTAVAPASLRYLDYAAAAAPAVITLYGIFLGSPASDPNLFSVTLVEDPAQATQPPLLASFACSAVNQSSVSLLATSATCAVPASAVPGVYSRVNLTLLDPARGAAGPLSYSIVPPGPAFVLGGPDPTVLSVVPPFGPRSGSFPVVLTINSSLSLVGFSGVSLAGAPCVAPVVNVTARTVRCNASAVATARSGPALVTTSLGSAAAPVVLVASIFTYAEISPRITALSPLAGLTSSAVGVRVLGTGFGASPATISSVTVTHQVSTIAPAACSGLVYISDSELTCVVPAAAAPGVAALVITTLYGSSATAAANPLADAKSLYTYYRSAPTLRALYPRTASAATGGQTLTLVGANFGVGAPVEASPGGFAILLGRTRCLNSTWISSTMALCAAPPRPSPAPADTLVEVSALGAAWGSNRTDLGFSWVSDALLCSPVCDGPNTVCDPATVTCKCLPGFTGAGCGTLLVGSRIVGSAVMDEDQPASVVMSVWLTEQPSATVAIPVALAPATPEAESANSVKRVAVSGLPAAGVIVFSPTDWSVPKTATLAAVPNTRRDPGGPAAALLVSAGPARSGDPRYDTSTGFLHPVFLLDSSPFIRAEPSAVLDVGGTAFQLIGLRFDPRIDVLFDGATIGRNLLSGVDEANDNLERSLLFLAPPSAPGRKGSYVDLTVVNLQSNRTASTKVYIGSVCVLPGFYPDPVTGACGPCPEGATCPGGDRLWPLRGWWNPGERSGFVVRCSPPEACVGGPSSLCAAGYTDSACSRCSDTPPVPYVRVGGYCEPCPPPARASLFLIADAATWGLVFLAYWMLEERQNVGFVLALVRCLQQMSSIGSSVDESFNPFARRTFHWFSLFSGDVTFMKINCFGEVSYVQNYFAQLAYSAILFVFQFAGLFIVQLLTLRFKAFNRRKLKDVQILEFFASRRRMGVLVFLSSVYYILTRKSLSVLFCGHLNSASTAGLVVVNSPYVKCFVGGHVAATVLACFVLAALTVGFPVWLTAHLHKNADKVGVDETFDERYDLFYGPLHVARSPWLVYYFLVSEVGFNLALVVADTFLVSNAVAQASFLIVIFVIMTLFALLFRPYHERIELGINLVIWLTGLVSAAASIAHARGKFRGTAKSATIYTIIAMVFLVICVLLFNIARGIVRGHAKSKGNLNLQNMTLDGKRLFSIEVSGPWGERGREPATAAVERDADDRAMLAVPRLTPTTSVSNESLVSPRENSSGDHLVPPPPPPERSTSSSSLREIHSDTSDRTGLLQIFTDLFARTGEPQRVPTDER